MAETVPTWDIDRGADAIAGSHDDDPEILIETRNTLARHVELGKGIAYYTNEDLGHYMLGHTVAFTYGTPQAQFEGSEPPMQCPDGLMRNLTGGINWRYRLVAKTVPLPVISN